VGPARTYGTYQGKADTTAKGAESATQTVLLITTAAAGHKTFVPYAAHVLADAEDQLSKLSGTFDSIQPPDHRADQLQQKLDDLLSTALTDVQKLRVAARRGDVTQLDDLAKPVRDDAKQFQDFVDSHQ
jgi:hypothetical protein